VVIGQRLEKEIEAVEPLIVIGVVALIIVLIVFGQIAAQKRREAMRAVAAKLGLRFDPERNSTLARRYEFLNRLHEGSNRYAFNILSGNHQSHDVTAFDFHYETHSTGPKGQRQTHHHYFSCFVLHLPAVFPELTIGPEGFFSKIAQAIGYDDIDLESHEFSRKFCVRSKDKKFAYDVCNAKMMEYLLANPDLVIEIEQDSLALSFSSQLSPENIEPNLNRLIAVRSLMPDYLFSRS
jgi:hypothetical protein